MASRFADINSVEQFIKDQENETKRKKTQQNVEKSSLSQVSECSTTTVHSASLAADYQQGQQAMSIFTGTNIHGGQFIISISSLTQRLACSFAILHNS